MAVDAACAHDRSWSTSRECVDAARTAVRVTHPQLGTRELGGGWGSVLWQRLARPHTGALRNFRWQCPSPELRNFAKANAAG